MLIIILIISISLILIGKGRIHLVKFSPSVNKALTLTGQFGLGFVVGSEAYAHGDDFMQGFWNGLASNVK